MPSHSWPPSLPQHQWPGIPNCRLRSLQRSPAASQLTTQFESKDLVSFVFMFPASTLPSREKIFKYLVKKKKGKKIRTGRRKEGRMSGKRQAREEAKDTKFRLSKSVCDRRPLACWMGSFSLVTGPGFIICRLTGLWSTISETPWSVHSSILLSYKNAHHACEGQAGNPFSVRFSKAKPLPPLPLHISADAISTPILFFKNSFCFTTVMNTKMPTLSTCRCYLQITILELW